LETLGETRIVELEEFWGGGRHRPKKTSFQLHSSLLGNNNYTMRYVTRPFIDSSIE
jgi:hypothetical protein